MGGRWQGPQWGWAVRASKGTLWGPTGASKGSPIITLPLNPWRAVRASNGLLFGKHGHHTLDFLSANAVSPPSVIRWSVNDHETAELAPVGGGPALPDNADFFQVRNGLPDGSCVEACLFGQPCVAGPNLPLLVRPDDQHPEQGPRTRRERSPKPRGNDPSRKTPVGSFNLLRFSSPRSGWVFARSAHSLSTPAFNQRSQGTPRLK